MTQYWKNDFLSADEKHLYTVEERAVSPVHPSTPRRLSGESSGSGSEYDSDLKQDLSNARKSYSFYYSSSSLNLRVRDVNQNTLYYVDNSCFTPGKPDVTVISGDNKGGKAVGVVRWSSMYAKKLTVGIGDGEDSHTTAWEDMKTEHAIHPQYKWYVEVDGKRHEFYWQRISFSKVKDADDSANRWSTKNFKLTDSTTGDVVAIFGSNRFKSWKKLGKLTFRADLGEQWEFMVLLTVLGLIEMSRRRGRQRRSAGAHGGP